MPCGRLTYTNPPLDISSQIDLLKERGLSIPNPERASRYLKFIGFHRLSTYCLPFQHSADPEHHFKDKTEFEYVLDLYIFDRKLRAIAMDAIGRIEIALRTVINERMSLQHGTQWYTDPLHFKRKKHGFDHAQFIEIVKKETGYSNSQGGSPSCRNYYAKYCHPVLPPSWMVAEVLSLGTWSRIYSSLSDPEDRKFISNEFHIRHGLFGSWIHAISHTRNICAHHSLLWNHVFTITPQLKYEFTGLDNKKFHAQALVLYQFLKGISGESRWKSRLLDHVMTCPLPYQAAMGFPQDWMDGSYWQ